MKKTVISAAIAATGLFMASGSASASMATDAVLQMGAQAYDCNYGIGTYPNCTAGSYPTANYFAMDNDGSGSWETTERVAIFAGADGGIALGEVQGNGDIDAAWSFFSNTGYHNQAATVSIASDNGAGDVTLDMTGWTVFWSGGAIDMGTGADAVVTCGSACGVGDTYTLDYNAVVPPSGGQFAGVAYQLHLSGTIGAPSAIPVPAAVWLFGSGLLGLVGVARRKKA